MKKSKINRCILILLIAFTTCLVCFAFTFNSNRKSVKATEAKIVAEIKDIYMLGETFTLGQVDISYNEQTYTSLDGVLVSPTGEAFSQGSYKLDDVGEYILKYSFKTEDGKYMVAQKSFSVQQLVYGVSSELSSYEYAEECPHYDKIDNYTAPWKTVAKDENGKTDFANSVLPEALTVKLAEGETFYYNSPVKLDSENITSLVHFYTPQYIDNYVAERIIIRITDCYDQENYIDIVNEYSRAIDFRTALPGTTSRYMSKGETLNVEHDRTFINGVSYVSRIEEDWGITLVASSPNPTVFVRDVTVGFDYKNSWTYALSHVDEWMPIIDTTNKDFFSDKAFKGFTSDEVFISIRGEKYAKSDLLELSIMEIDGVKGQDLQATNYFDNEKPEISVEYQQTDHNGVYIVKDEEFKLFNATATDINLIDGVSAEVFYLASGIPVTVDCANGKFTPTKVGEYSVVYSAKDKYGNIAQESVRLMCIEVEDGKATQFSVEKLTEVKVGEDIFVPQPTVLSINGNVDTVAQIVYPDNTVYSVDFSKAIIIEKLGDYKLIYNYGDRYYGYTYEYNFRAIQSDVVRFIEEPVVPTYLMAGKKCSIDSLLVYDYTNEQIITHEAQTMVKFDDGEYQAIDANNFTVDVNAKTAKFMYSYEGVEPCYSAEIPVVNVGSRANVDMTKYFVGEFDAQAQTDGIVFSTQRNGEKLTLDFINKTVINGFEFKFKLLENYDNFEKFNVVFTDYYDRQNTIKLSFIKNNGGLALSIDGEENNFMRSNFASDTESINVSYNSLTEYFNLRNFGSYKFEHDFKTGYCLISFELEGVYGQSKILLEQLLNQTLTATTRDNVGPVVSYTSKINYAKTGEEFVIARACAVDVLSGVLNEDFTLVVTDPNGNFVMSKDGVLLDGTCPTDREYVILLEKVGDYSILFDAKDTNGRQTISPGWLSLNSIGDEQGPNVVIKDNAKLSLVSINLGETHTINIDASDDYDEKQDIVVSVAVYNNAQGNYVYYNLVNFDKNQWEQSHFTPNQRGSYTVYVYAYDSLGNITVKDYQLNVK